MTYEMTVVKQNGSWYVQAIGPSGQQPGGAVTAATRRSARTGIACSAARNPLNPPE